MRYDTLLKARLYEIQISPQTYCTEPDGPIDKFNDWKLTFDLESKKGEISELLVSVDEVRTIYTKLVSVSPAQCKSQVLNVTW